MPDEPGPPEALTNQELKQAIEQAPPRTARWNALISEAGRRPSFPPSWLPDGENAPLTDLELKNAINRTHDQWNALLREAFSRPTFPHSWLPAGVVWSERTDLGSSGIKGDGT
jgi:hypothetical protein